MKMTRNLCKRLSAFSAFLAAMLATLPAYAILGQPEPGGTALQASASPMKERMIFFHDSLMMPIITAISVFVLLLLLIVIFRFNSKANPVPSKTTHNTVLEVLWTLVPVLILVVVVIPSMKMLYYVDKTTESEMTLKAIGDQWYWNYEYPDNGISFASNIVQDKDLKPGQPRLLETDNPVVLPINTNIKILTASTDVIHSWAVPAFGIKMDAVPGRLNETWVRIDKEGTFYGQCSQLCGQNHAYMPIEVKAVSKEAFADWVHKQGGKMSGDTAAAAPAAAAPVAASAPAKNAPKKIKNKKAGEK